MTHTLQPYRKFDVSFINQLTYKGIYYLVSQSYRRANVETDHTKKPILFTPYKDDKEGAKHYEQLKKKDDPCAAFVDIRKKKVATRLVEMCYGKSDKIPYIALVANLQYVNKFLFRHYYDKYRSWVKKNKPEWNIREHNAVEPHFITVMGEPMVKIMYGKQFVVVSLEELESL